MHELYSNKIRAFVALIFFIVTCRTGNYKVFENEKRSNGEKADKKRKT